MKRQRFEFIRIHNGKEDVPKQIDHDKLVELWRTFSSLEQIAIKLDVSTMTIRKELKKLYLID
tara:strand:+ start:244 stop:432 length:189 start_codon:yes stop_codon:yes gene_type:complete